MSAPDLVITGGVIIDNVVTPDGQVRRGQIGGNALYAAAGAALWGARPGIGAHVPANYPEAALAALVARGFDLSGVGRAGVAVGAEEWFFYRADGSRRDQLFASPEEADRHGMAGPQATPGTIAAFATHLAARSAPGLTYGAFRRAHPIRPAHLPAPYWQAKGLHLAANGVAEQIALAREARARGLWLSWDPGPRAADLDREALAILLGLVDAALPSEAELALLRPGLAPGAALESLGPLARGLLAVKRGAAGVLVLGEGMHAPLALPARPVTVADPTGAGDAFCGGVLAGLCAGEAGLAAIHRGIASASLAVATIGPLALLDAEAPSLDVHHPVPTKAAR